ncbi:MAG: hypothetical protein QOE35_3490 [Actinomycetota bacterium]|jgi:SAM-dependent methyltransferase
MASRRELFRLFLAEKRDPVPFHEHLAQQTVAEFPFDLVGQLVIDLGCGPGHYTRALRRAGASVMPIDLDPSEFLLPGGPPKDETVADGGHLPIRSACVDGVFCSNMLEHVPDHRLVLDEVERVLRPGGWAWISWTNWYSPWGGHELSPFHYLGPRLGLAVYRRLRGEPKNTPGLGLFPVHVGPTLAAVRRRPGLEMVAVAPRYWPRQRWLLRVPVIREVFTWNCVMLLRRRWT